MEDLHEEVVTKITTEQHHKPFFVSDRLLHDPKKRSFYVHKISKQYDDLLRHISETINRETIVVVGLVYSPFIDGISKIFEMKGYPEYVYMEFGTLFTRRADRDAIKMWSGWPTFPQVFINGFLLGGYSELQASCNDSTLDRLLSTKRTSNVMVSGSNTPTHTLSPPKSLAKRGSKQRMTKLVTEKKDFELDEEFYKKCLDLQDVTLEDLGVTKKFRLDESEFKQPYSEITQNITKMNIVITPEDQLKLLENAINQITQEIEYHQKKKQEYKEEVIVGADDMIPILIYCVIKAKVKKMFSVFRELSEKCDFKGNTGYVLACLDTAMQTIASMKSKKYAQWKWENVLLNDFMLQ